MSPPIDDQKNTLKKNKKSTTKRRKKNASSNRLSVKKVIEAIKETGGIVTTIAEKLQCSRQTVYNYIDNHEEVKKALKDEKDVILDVCEESIFAKIYNGDIDVIKYYLSKHGHSRGYGEGPNPNAGNDEAGIIAKILGALNAPVK